MTLGAWALYALAALAEIAGCFAVWAWWRQGASAWWLLPGGAALAAFAYLLALTPSAVAGRSFAVYAGVYLIGALAWMALVEGEGLRARDLLGAALVLGGAVVIFAGSARAG